MKACTIIFTLLVCKLSLSYADDYVVSNKRFPKNFMFGTASAAVQVEGAWNLSGKGENIWDNWAHNNPDLFPNGNADVACDQYHKYKEDVQIMKDIGANTYRFSVGWARIFPTGIPDKVNQEGLQYYKNLLAELKAANIEPIVSMYHWDLPQYLQELGGFHNESIVDHFAAYARVLFEELGNDVKYWATFNEPRQTCLGGYEQGYSAPGYVIPGTGGYLCTHNVLKAHAKVWHMYDDEFRATQKGKLSMVIDTPWYEPATNSSEDIEAAERMLQFQHGWFAHPIYFGNYPQVMIDRVKARSLQEGYNVSRLPEFTKHEQDYLKGTADFMAINVYTTNLVSYIDDAPIGTPMYNNDLSVNVWQPDDWETTIIDWFKVVPWGARSLLVWLKKTYDNPEIIVTENGYVDTENVNDMETRGRYHKLYLSNINDALFKDEVNVIGYMAWCLIDDFEWTGGSFVRMGLYDVDFKDPDLPRTPKASGVYYKQVCTTRCLVDNDDCVD